jgi:hypothetical protein
MAAAPRRPAVLAPLILSGLAALWLPPASPSHALESPEGPASREICVLLESEDVGQAWSVAERLAASGCAEVTLEGTGVLQATARDDAIARARATRGVRLVLTGPADAALLRSVGGAPRAALERWNARLALAAAKAASGLGAPELDGADAAPGASLADGGCAVLPPIAAPRVAGKTAAGSADIPHFATYNRAWGAADFQTSEFLLGRIAVAIVTPQTSTQRWSAEEMLAVHAAARDAMTYWRAQANNGKMPVFLAYEYLDSLFTAYSVLTDAGDSRWVNSLMASAQARLGIAGKTASASTSIPEPTFPDAYRVLNHLRRKYTADWAVMIIVGHGDRFTDAPGLGAYAYLGGPFLVAPNKPLRWGLTGLLVHESGHLFFALDEYCSSDGNCGGTSSPCTAVSGYLRVPNRNSLNRSLGGCIQNPVPCAMNYPGLRSCSYSEGMMGVQDTDRDGILDILDTQPIVELFARDGSAFLDSTGRRVLTDTVRTLTPTYEGFVREAPLPNLVVASGTGAGALALDPLDESGLAASSAARPNISMNILEAAEYRVDDGPWAWIRPDSSGYDAPVEDFRVAPAGLSGGTHTIEFRGTNSAGNTTESRATLKERVVVLAIAFDNLTLAQQRAGGLAISWNVRGKAWDSTARLYRSEDGGPDTLLASFPLADGGATSASDLGVRPGRRYRYRVEADAFGKTFAVETEGIAAVPMPDPEARLSSASPNPFTDETVLSFAVPEGILGIRPPTDGGNKPGPPPILPPSSPADPSSKSAAANLSRLPVLASLSIHDVTGRAVRHIVDDALDGQRIYTYRWDGRNDGGERVPTGVYFARLTAGTYQDATKIMLIR